LLICGAKTRNVGRRQHRRSSGVSAAVLISCLLTGCGGSSSSGGTPPAAAYTAFANATPVTITGYAGDAMEPFISKDGQYLFFNNRNDPSINTDIYYAARVDDQTFTFLGPVVGVNSPALDAVASLDTLGNFYFVSTRSYAASLSTLYSGQLSSAGVTNAVVRRRTVFLDRHAAGGPHCYRQPAGLDVRPRFQQRNPARVRQRIRPQLCAQHLRGRLGAVLYARRLDHIRRLPGDLSNLSARHEFRICNARTRQRSQRICGSAFALRRRQAAVLSQDGEWDLSHLSR
jgi:hypothetical protein